MSTDLPDFVSDDPSATPAAPAAETPQPEAASAEAAPAAPAPAEGQPRGPDGKFAPVASDPVAAAPQAPVEAAQPAQPPETHHVPLATALDWRDRMTAAEKRATELETWRQQQESQARARPVAAIPDPGIDPAGYHAYQQQQVDARLYEMTRDFSRRLAEREHGKETVDHAFQWAADRIDQELRQAGRSSLNDEVRNSSDPISLVMDHWKREQTLSKVGNLDPSKIDAFLAWEAAQAAPAPQASAPAVAIPQAPAAPRASLASAPSAAGHAEPIPRDGEATYGAMFS